MLQHYKKRGGCTVTRASYIEEVSFTLRHCYPINHPWMGEGAWLQLIAAVVVKASFT
jgi:hypothetical protein